MSIRITLFSLIVVFLSGYAWFRSWFLALCGMIVLMAFLEHRDMPRAIAGITGLNLWNFLYLNVFFAWLSQRSSEGFDWDMPRKLKWAIFGFWSVLMVSSIRLIIDPTEFFDSDFGESLIDHLINPFKVFLPCIMLYDGCRDRERIMTTLGAIVLSFLLLAVQTVHYMGIDSLARSGASLSNKAIQVLDRRVGYHRVDLSMIFAGAFWAVIAFSQALVRPWIRWAVICCAPVILLGQAVTGGRTGYATWLLIGLILCSLRWRRFLLLIPVGIVAAVVFMPGVQERMLMGFGGADRGQGNVDLMTVTSGRSAAWPFVLEKIKHAPLVGYGKEAMRRTGLFDWIENEKQFTNEISGGFSHPHNAYLEFVFDNGLIGFFIALPLFVISIRGAFWLFLRERDPLFLAVGGFALSLILGLLIASLGAQTFYPRIGTFGMWAAIGLVWRVVENRRQQEYGGLLEDEDWTMNENLPGSSVDKLLKN